MFSQIVNDISEENDTNLGFLSKILGFLTCKNRSWSSQIQDKFIHRFVSYKV
jgi:hypothetical protein